MYKFLGWTFSMGTFFGKFEMQSRLIILQSNDYANSRCLFYSFTLSPTSPGSPKKIDKKNDAIFSIYGRKVIMPWHIF